MLEQRNERDTNAHNEFVRQAKSKSGGLLREYVDLLRCNKKWWLTPIIISLLLLGILVVLSSTPLAPVIYTLF